MLLNKHQVFAADDIKTNIVDMQKEWGGDVKIKVMSVGEQLAFDEFINSQPDDKQLAFYLITRSCVDEDNKLMFNDSDIEFLKQKSPESILKLFNAILDINRQQPADVENLAKNS